MSATPDSTLANAEQLIADLQRQLADCKAERDEGLQRETANAEVLHVINSSPGELAPVFDAMLEKAARLCEAHTGHLGTWENGALTRVASFGVPEEFDQVLPRNAPMPDALVRGSVTARMIRHGGMQRSSDEN